MHVGIAGEVRCVVTKADGTVRLDTGFQKNLILNQGLDFFGGGKGDSLFARCAIGSGNSVPTPTQTQLDAFIATATGTLHSTKYDYVDDGSGLYKTNSVYKYRFTGLGDINIGEVGLVSTGSTSTNYYLCTRAQMKDSSGALTTISLNTGETLDIFYKVWAVYSTTDTSYTINYTGAEGEPIPYTAIVRLSRAGNPDYVSGGWIFAQPFYLSDGRSALLSGHLFSGDIGDVKNIPTGVLGSGKPVTSAEYVVGSYKKTGHYHYPLASANGTIRSFAFGSTLGMFQMRFGSVSDDSPIKKTAKDTLTIPLNFSWGRYEGAL